MLQIILNIDDTAIDRFKDALAGLYPIPQIDDPNWIDPGDGSEAPKVDRYTKEEWLSAYLEGYLEKTVRRYEKKQGIQGLPVADVSSYISTS